MQAMQRILNFTDIQVLYISRQNLETVGISHSFLPLTIAKLQTLNVAHAVQPLLSSDFSQPEPAMIRPSSGAHFLP